jgi:hypothetical protein
MTWEEFNKMEERFPFARPTIRVNMFEKPTPLKQGYLPNFRVNERTGRRVGK